MNERPPDRQPAGETAPADEPDKDTALKGYVPHHREEFVDWIEAHPPPPEREATDEPESTLDESA